MRLWVPAKQEHFSGSNYSFVFGQSLQGKLKSAGCAHGTCVTQFASGLVRRCACKRSMGA
jgi:hypothetical protein